ncbi:hypothetical protein GCM10017774_21620 [Lentzea cavernae]|uniref:Uncharacterized protein n=2 Tax=Lentzea cavernae TaxID=2020703 RepID=A0ABQ3MAI4_9PSEU|nr:hypothetical protein GCM10017774_21620 [Lentzea cavernae]
MVRVEAMLGLEWSSALEAPNPDEIALTPAQARRSWVNRAPEHEVLTMFRSVRDAEDAPAPWWLRALDRGRLRSRAEGHAVEDAVSELLAARPGWVFVPWVDLGEVGYWEYVPSESGVYGPATPTTVQFTDSHRGFVHLVPAHRGAGRPQPIDFTVADLRAQIEDIELIA